MTEYAKVLVCGGRRYSNMSKVYGVLNELADSLKPKEVFVISGGAPGADYCAQSWAKTNHLPCAVVEPNWLRYREAAGPIRNGWMLALSPDMVIAFPGGNGTRNMVTQAEEAGVKVVQIMEESA